MDVSSTSFSIACKVRRLDGGGDWSVEVVTFFLEVEGNGAAVKAASGREAVAEEAAGLIEA